MLERIVQLAFPSQVAEAILFFGDLVALFKTLIARGATVYTGMLEAGDAVYVPTGALHGGSNEFASDDVREDGVLSVAVSAHFLDEVYAERLSPVQHGRGGLRFGDPKAAVPRLRLAPDCRQHARTLDDPDTHPGVQPTAR